MAAPWQGLPVRLERAPHRGAAFALSNASKRARTRSIGSRSRARQIISMLPKQVSFENVTARELADEELGRLIEAFRQRELELREERALAEMKLIPNAAHG
jgi:hypothetical protein